jgi:hypothetical protein
LGLNVIDNTSVYSSARRKPPGVQTSLENAASESRIAEKLSSYIPKGCTLVAFLLPLKLSLTYIALIPLILAWVYIERGALIKLLASPASKTITAPLCFFLLMATISTASGLSILHSIPSLISLFFFALTIPLFATGARPLSVVTALLAGQSVAAIHSFFEATFPGSLPRFFLGKMTESGQLTLTTVVALGLCIMWYRSLPKRPTGSYPLLSCNPYLTVTVAITLTAALILLGFRTEAAFSWSATLTLTLVALTCLALTAYSMRRLEQPFGLMTLLATTQLPLLLCALVVNLKRGPWLGVLVGASLLFLLYARRLALIAIAGAAFIVFAVAPVRQRLLDSWEHFTISGGRSTIWRIGTELASEYPLGIGYHNSGILRKFAPEIPPELKHFHNNLLNIAAETGWLGVAVFIWFIVAVVKVCFRDTSSPLYVAIGCAIISWQTAGLVEYNFGDSEVTIVVWALLGLVLQRELKASRA